MEQVVAMARKPQRTGAHVSLFNSLPAQFLLAFMTAVVLPPLVRFGNVESLFGSQAQINSVLGATVALGLGMTMLRRVTAYPGTRTFGYILPSFAGSFGLVFAGILAFRLQYSGVHLSASFLITVFLFFILSIYLAPRTRRLFYVVPGFDLDALLVPAGAEWIRMSEPTVPPDPSGIIVADFRRDHGAAWERMLAEAAVKGRTVLHSKQLLESLTGRVSIEHLSENTFGSLLPNLAWRRVKRAIDLGSALLLLPVLLPFLLLVGLAIRLNSPGPALFRQLRVGVGGHPFRIIKFRTMRHGSDGEADIGAAMTRDDDHRITSIGRWLRRTRVDELPQIFNIIAGDMSWIGPRPEAMSLSEWYDVEIPFYLYRHIVRPGITGWAQVNQGHVTNIAEIDLKLQYDFYYIKNFSAWIDILIALRTLRILFTGFGAK